MGSLPGKCILAKRALLAITGSASILPKIIDFFVCKCMSHKVSFLSEVLNLTNTQLFL